MDYSKLLHGLVKIDTQISLNFYMDLSNMDLFKLLLGFVKVVLYIFRALPFKIKLKFDQDFKTC